MKGCTFTTIIFIVCLGNIPVISNTVTENLSENDPTENSDDQADEYELTDNSFQSNSKEDNLYAPSTSHTNKHTNKKKNVHQFF